MASSARIVIGSYMVRYPLGGMLSWALQYVVGLHRLGHHVVFVERADYPNACFDPIKNEMTDDATYGVRVVKELFERFGMDGRYCFVDHAGIHHGMSAGSAREAFRNADVFVDMGTHGAWNDAAEASRLRVLIDGEPGFTQMKRESALRAGAPIAEYDAYYTSGVNVGTSRSAAPTGRVEWRPLPHPVVVDLFTPSPPPAEGAVTTVMNWQSYDRVRFEGHEYGHKDLSFEKFKDLPSRVNARLELAVAGPNVPTSKLTSLGWVLRDGHGVTRSVDDFWTYLRESLAEFSICKEGYVSLRTGWFSDRGGAYLALGRPVVQQDTGFGDVLPCGEGLFAVSTVEEAAAALDAVLTDPIRHGRAAREIAEEHLDSTKVLGAWVAELLR